MTSSTSPLNPFLLQILTETDAIAAQDIHDLSDNQVEEIINELNSPLPDIEQEGTVLIPSLSTVILSAIATLPLPDLSTADAAVVSAYLQDIINQK